jgi:predicted  nucleic acid-binding Zn-ribbon protein
LKRHLVTLEDRLIEAMQESETAEIDYQSVKIRVESATNNQVELSKRLRQEQEINGNELERFETEYNAASGSIPENDLVLYNQLRLKRRGVAVAVISDNACGACGSTLSRAQIQFARSPEHMLLCPSCGRILYGN